MSGDLGDGSKFSFGKGTFHRFSNMSWGQVMVFKRKALRKKLLSKGKFRNKKRRF